MKPFSNADIVRLTAWLAQQDNFVFLESSRLSIENHRSLLFLKPSHYLLCYPHDDGANFLAQVDQYRKQGFFLAGWLNYEFAYLLEPRLHHFLVDSRLPLAVLGVYQEPLIFDHLRGQWNSKRWPDAEQKNGEEKFTCADLQTSIKKEEYLQAIERIQEYIHAGDTYQVNFTLHVDFSFQGSVADLYRSLRRNQSVGYSAWIRHHGRDILSFSPELFFRADQEKVRVRPMKGTLRRGRNNAEDQEQHHRLHSDLKNRSENVMIVDLLRNDLACLLHSLGGGAVLPRNLFAVECYESLLQMTSTIDGISFAQKPSFQELIQALFPCGSVTGAPKIRTMEIIHELERQQRGVYCGAIGYTSETETCLNVPIRTVELENGTGKMGIGSGIVADSKAEEEWAECLLKGNFLTVNEPDFQLIETLLWQPETGFFLFEYHLERLADSAHYFHFFCDIAKIRSELEAVVEQKTQQCRVRLLLYRDGEISITAHPMPAEQPSTELRKVIFSQEEIDPNTPYLFHKTTRRNRYDQERERALAQGYDEVLFTNTAGQVTEGAISTLFIADKEQDILLTPPLACGLLAGTYRRLLLEQGKAVERILTVQDLQEAETIYLANSVRGLSKVVL
jgi:para-aminobenzoate synthetase / 4-amino-4-deoxychorismate lyase